MRLHGLFIVAVLLLMARPVAAATSPQLVVAVVGSDFTKTTPCWDEKFDAGSAFADLLINRLVKSGNLAVVDHDKLRALLNANNLADTQEAKLVSFGSEAKISRTLGAQSLIVGKIWSCDYNTQRTTATLDVSFQVIDSYTGQSVANKHYTGTADVSACSKSGLGTNCSPQVRASGIVTLMTTLADDFVSGMASDYALATFKGRIIAIHNGDIIL
jgi:curli biogenesis system outer membrane secretion channel CsgG